MLSPPNFASATTEASHQPLSDDNDTYPGEADDDVPELPSPDNFDRRTTQQHFRSHPHCSGDHNARSLTILSSSSDGETASNRTGAGRAIGQIYSALGWRLERIIGLLAHKMGLGPRAAAEHVWIRYVSYDKPSNSNKSRKKKLLLEAVDKLLSFLNSDIESNRLTTLKCIIGLATTFPATAALFREHGVLEKLEQVWNSHRRFVLSSSESIFDDIATTSERAAASIVMNDSIGKVLASMSGPWHSVYRGTHKIYEVQRYNRGLPVQIANYLNDFSGLVAEANESTSQIQVGEQVESARDQEVHHGIQKHYPWVVDFSKRTWRKLLDAPMKETCHICIAKREEDFVNLEESKQVNGGFTAKEIVRLASNLHDICACAKFPLRKRALRRLTSDVVCGVHCERFMQ